MPAKSTRMKPKEPIPEFGSREEEAEFWDTHDLADYWDRTVPVEFELDLESEATYFPLDRSLAARVLALARQRGVSPETLLNLWVQERSGKS